MTFNYEFKFSNEFHINLPLLDMCIHIQKFITNPFIVDLLPIIFYVPVKIIE